MIHTTDIKCPHCGSTNLVKQGKTGNGTQKWQCSSCKKHFRPEYRYRAWQAGIKEKIIEMTLNSSGVRDTGRVLKISKDTVCSVLKKTSHTNPYFLTCSELYDYTHLEVDLHFSAEMDGFWSFVQHKGNQRRTWYALERRSGIILAWHSGKRQDRDFFSALGTVKTLSDTKVSHRSWEAYSKYIPPHKHRIGKDRTWKTERKNLNFRTHLKGLNRKTVCFSKNEQIHDNVIGMYIEKYYYKTGTYGNNSS